MLWNFEFELMGLWGLKFHESEFNRMRQSQILWMGRLSRLFMRIFWNCIWEQGWFWIWSLTAACWSKTQILGMGLLSPFYENQRQIPPKLCLIGLRLSILFNYFITFTWIYQIHGIGSWLYNLYIYSFWENCFLAVFWVKNKGNQCLSCAFDLDVK